MGKFSNDPRVIYLAPKCCYADGERRQWREENVWPCSDCPEPKNARVAKYFLGTQIPGPGHEDRAEYEADPVK